MRSNVGERLVGWKSIGAFLGRDARTAKRWEASRAMPVQRTPGLRPTVWADSRQLLLWMHGRYRSGEEVEAWVGDNARYPAGSDLQDLYIQVRAAAEGRTPPGLEFATAAGTELTRRSPSVVAGHIALAECHLLSREFGSVTDHEGFEGAAASVKAAQRIAGLSADVSRILGFIQFWREDELSGVDLLKRAVEMAPDDARSRHWLATAHCAAGDVGAAMVEYAAAQRLTPGATEIFADYALANLAAGNRERARAQLELLLRIAPSLSAPPTYLSQLDLLEGRDEDFITHQVLASSLRGEGGWTDLAEELRCSWRTGGAAAMRWTYAEQRERAFLAGRDTALTVARAWSAALRPDRAVTWKNRLSKRRRAEDYFLSHFL